MRLAIKNKMQLAICKLYSDNEEIGGTPDKFLLDKKEFGMLMVELHHQGKGNSDTFNIQTKNDKSILMDIYRVELSNKGINSVIKRWIRKEFSINFKSVPIMYAPLEKLDKETNRKKWQG